MEYGKSLPKNKRINGSYPVMGSNGVDGYHNEYLIKAPCIIVGRKGSAGKVNFINENCYPIDTTFYTKYKSDIINIKYLYYLLLELDLESIAKGKGIGVPGLNRNYVHNIKVSIPELKEQNIIVEKIEKLETEIKSIRLSEHRQGERTDFEKIFGMKKTQHSTATHIAKLSQPIHKPKLVKECVYYNAQPTDNQYERQKGSP